MAAMTHCSPTVLHQALRFSEPRRIRVCATAEGMVTLPMPSDEGPWHVAIDFQHPFAGEAFVTSLGKRIAPERVDVLRGLDKATTGYVVGPAR